MASNWKGIVHVRENEDKRPLWQRRTNRRAPAIVAESGSESGPGTTSSGDSRSSSADDDRLETPKSRVLPQLSPIIGNRIDFDRLELGTSGVGRSSSFRETDPPSSPYSPGMGGYRRSGSPYGSPYASVVNRGGSSGDHLTADYVPSWRPDRRFSTPAVPRLRGSFSRSPSPRFASKTNQQQFEYFRNRAASLPASSGSTPNRSSSARKLQQRHQHQNHHASDYWPQTRSPSRVEQRFLKLTESADYDKVRTFVIGAKGELVERGFCYRHRSETGSSSSPGSTGPAASPNEERSSTSDAMNMATVINNANNESGSAESSPARIVPKYTILVIGAPAVGKSSLLSLLKESQQARVDDSLNASTVDSELGIATVIPILICGEEVHLQFYEFNATDIDIWSTAQWQAAIVIYSISDKRSFSSAADALYQIRAIKKGDVASQKIPIVLVANKIDLERHRQVHDQEGMELAKSYNCRFVDTSAELGHRVEDLLSAVMNEIWQSTVTAYRQRCIRASKSPNSSFEDDNNTPKKSKRFSLRNIGRKSKGTVVIGQPRSSRAKSLYTLPDGLPAALSNVSTLRKASGGGFLSRLLGRRTAKSCEDLFSRLLRG